VVGARELDRGGGPTAHRHGAGQQAVVGSDEVALASADLDGDGAARRADAGIDDREHHPGAEVLRRPAQGEAAGSHVVGRDLVGEVDDGDVGSDGADHGLHDTDELVTRAVVRQEGDRVEPVRHGAAEGTGAPRRIAYPASLNRDSR
jgi:hypothetical protein